LKSCIGGTNNWEQERGKKNGAFSVYKRLFELLKNQNPVKYSKKRKARALAGGADVMGGRP